MNESTVTLALRKALNDVGWFAKISDRFYAGIPDLVGCCCGGFVAIEMKIDENIPTKLQNMNLMGIVSRGGLSFVCTYDRDRKQYRIIKKHPAADESFSGSAAEVAQWILKLCRSRISGSVSS